MDSLYITLTEKNTTKKKVIEKIEKLSYENIAELLLSLGRTVKQKEQVIVAMEH